MIGNHHKRPKRGCISTLLRKSSPEGRLEKRREMRIIITKKEIEAIRELLGEFYAPEVEEMQNYSDSCGSVSVSEEEISVEFKEEFYRDLLGFVTMTVRNGKKLPWFAVIKKLGFKFMKPVFALVRSVTEFLTVFNKIDIEPIFDRLKEIDEVKNFVDNIELSFEELSKKWDRDDSVLERADIKISANGWIVEGLRWAWDPLFEAPTPEGCWRYLDPEGGKMLSWLGQESMSMSKDPEASGGASCSPLSFLEENL